MKNINPTVDKNMLEDAIYTSQDQVNYEKKSLQQINNLLKTPETLQNYLQSDSGLVIEDGQIKLLPNRHHTKQDICIVDTITFTVNEESYNTAFSVDDNELILSCSEKLNQIFGFGITLVRNNGINFYKRSFELGDGYGFVGHGGQNNTLMVTINATGLHQSKDSWQSDLYNFLKNSIQPTITRIDLAHDIFNAPRFLLDFYLTQFDNGKFNNGKRSPAVSQAGNWLTENDNGRTFYIGKRTNGLYCRIYEKGLQLNDKDKPYWLRLEVEFKSVDRYIDLEILLEPHLYLAGAYPAFRHLHYQFKRIDTYQHEVKADLEHREKWAKRQSGGLIKLLTDLGYTPDDIIKKLQSENYPKPFQQKFLESSKENLTAIPTSGKFQSNPLDLIFQSERE